MASRFPFDALARLYGQEASTIWERRFLTLVSDLEPARRRRKQRGEVWLLAYPTHVTSDASSGIQALHTVVKKLDGVFTHLHLLPPFSSDGDFGFAPTDHLQFTDGAGNWDDLLQLASEIDVSIDLILNHVARAHPWAIRAFATEVLEQEDPFIRTDPNADFGVLAQSRHHPPISKYEAGDGPRTYWTRYGRNQIDLDYRKPSVLFAMAELLVEYASRGVSGLRLDALAFLWKDLGRPSANEPEVFDLLEILRWVSDQAGLGVLIAEGDVRHGFSEYVTPDNNRATVAYRYESAPVILATILRGDGRPFMTWIANHGAELHCTPALNFLSTHDGVYLRPTDNPLSRADLTELARATRAAGGTVSERRVGEVVRPYELDVTVTDLLDEHGDSAPRIAAATALACWLPGTPIVYLGHLLEIRNDDALVQTSGDERARNRGSLTLNEALRRLETDRADGVMHAMKRFREAAQEWDAFEPDAPIALGPDYGPSAVSIIRMGTTSTVLCVLALAEPVVFQLPSGYSSGTSSTVVLQPWQTAFYPRVYEPNQVP